MKLKSWLFLLILLALPVFSYADEIELKINGVGLESTLETVKTKLGKPVSEKKMKADENCHSIGQFSMELNYAGLKISLLSDENGKNFKVIGMKLTSAKRKYENGITIGATQKRLIVKFGNPDYIFSTPSNKTYNYIHKGDSSSANFIFRKGKLYMVEWEKKVC